MVRSAALLCAVSLLEAVAGSALAGDVVETAPTTIFGSVYVQGEGRGRRTTGDTANCRPTATGARASRARLVSRGVVPLCRRARMPRVDDWLQAEHAAHRDLVLLPDLEDRSPRVLRSADGAEGALPVWEVSRQQGNVAGFIADFLGRCRL